MRKVFTDVATGAITQLYAGTAPETLDMNGAVSYHYSSTAVVLFYPCSTRGVACGAESKASPTFKMETDRHPPLSQYFTAYARLSKPSNKAQDVELAKKVWDFCEEQVKGF